MPDSKLERDVREFLRDNPNSVKGRSLAEIPAAEKFDMFLQWHGIQGSTRDVLSALRELGWTAPENW